MALFVLIFSIPFFVEAQGIVPNCNRAVDAQGRFVNPCDFNDILVLVKNVVDFMIFTLAIPLITIVFAYAGWLYMTSGGDSGNRTKAKKMLMNVLVGYAIALGAWLIVNTILNLFGVPDTFRFLE